MTIEFIPKKTAHLLILVAGLLLASPNTCAAEGKNPRPTTNPPQYEPALEPEIQLEIERPENRLSPHENIMDIKLKATEDRFDDRFDDFFVVVTIVVALFAIFIALLGVGGYALIKQAARERINEEVKKLNIEELIQKRVDALYKTFDPLYRWAIEKIETIKPGEMTPVQKEIVAKEVERIREKREEAYSAKDYHMLAIDAAEKNNIEDGIKYSQKAIQLDSNYVGGYWSLGVLYSMDGQYDKAIEVLNNGIQQVPNLPTIYYSLACVYSRKKDKDNTLKYLETATDKGFDDIKYIEEDRDIDFIRNTPEYQRIINKLKVKR